MALKKFISRRPYLALLGIAIIVAVAAWLLLRGRPPKLPVGALGADQPITGDDRVLIIAPHCDDETLGAGGLMHEAIAAGAEVRAIMVTNGDGFRYAVEAELKTLRPTPEEYIQFACRRQQETLAAVKLLGLAPENVIFLGYPDRGIADLWATNWSAANPYRSRFTGRTASPYSNSFTANAPYAGEQLAADLSTLFVRFRPTLIVFPHPNDAHVDHWAVNAFVNYTLQGLSERGESWAEATRQRLYLVHRGEWPNPKGLNLRLPLLPPKTMLNTQTRWLARDLPEQVTALKRDAILTYHSQVSLMREYLLSFARKNELFGVLEPVPLPLLTNLPTAAAVPGLTRIIIDPVGDTMARRVEPGGDIVAVDAGRSSSHLYLRITTHSPARADVSYNIHFVPLGAVSSRSRARLGLRFSPPSRLTVTSPPGGTTGATGVSSGADVTIEVPLSELEHPELLYVSVDTSIVKLGIDRAAWTLLDLDSQPQGPASGGQ